MQNLSEHLATLWNNAEANLCDVINLHGKKSRFMEAQCIDIDNPQLQRLLDGGRALVEITPTILLDEGGYQYNHDVLNSEQFMQLVDYLVEKYKVYEGETEPDQEVVITVKGGIVQSVIHNVQDLNVNVVDFDIEDQDEDDLRKLNFNDEETEKAYTYQGEVDDYNPELISKLSPQLK